ncbi:type II toxin-antitoxin system VapC family toxin [Galactobacter sp.]|uniref:type II toxin-antitoxin system VapC family toxin n=1 Tax=Galactobacter sp. TaxID=2676125 RepID=UPI0025BDAE94|nr:type II toxin-antitoxin system VapC family toxin [Galactobacter sp.]
MNTPIVVDTSALIAVLFAEEDADVYLDALDRYAGRLVLSQVTRVELRIVVESRHGSAGVARLARLMAELHAECVPIDDATSLAAIAGWRQYGKGRHPARLNLGDCFSYALAKNLGAPLLFKGNDFSQTDIVGALQR